MNTQTLERLDLDFEVIGKGRMPTESMQIGDWWVVPAHEYNSTIPPEAMRKICALINQGVRIKGLLVADDVKKTTPEEKHQEEVKEPNQTLNSVFSVVGAIAGALGMIALGVVWILGAALSYDPMLVAVLEDGRWICVHSWYE